MDDEDAPSDDDSDETQTPGTPAENATEREDTKAVGAGEAGLQGLAEREGWHVEGAAARVHYSGGSERYSIEYYAASQYALYWRVPSEDGGETATPVAREDVPDPLRERIREDLAAAGIDPDVERRRL